MIINIGSRYLNTPPFLTYRPEMAEAPARVQEGGRLTVPVEIRRELELSRGDYVLITVRPLDGVGSE